MKTLKMLSIATTTSLLALAGCGDSDDATWTYEPAADLPLAADVVAPADDDTGLEVRASAEQAEDAEDMALSTSGAPPAAAPGPATPLGSARQALGNNCQNISINITNLRERDGQTVPVLVRYVKYWNADEGDWVEEGLENTQINYKDSATWIENLEGAEGDDILSWRVYYSFSTGNEWSGTYYQYIDTTNQQCQDGMSVDLELR
jgi:hypothetical protein